MESVTDKLNVSTNVLDVPTGLVRTKSGGNSPPPPHLAPIGYANTSYTSFLVHLYNMQFRIALNRSIEISFLRADLGKLFDIIAALEPTYFFF